MLQQVCEHLHNFFVESDKPDTYTISGGMISPAVPLKEGQRFRIVGSSLNDGVYTHHGNGIKNDDDSKAAVLADEEFKGSICPMAVPRGVIAIAAEIADWQDKYGEAVLSPYTSENVIGVYSYTKNKGNSGNDDGEASWQTKFKSRLDAWRKICL